MVAAVTACQECDPVEDTANELIVAFFNSEQRFDEIKVGFDSVFTVQGQDTLGLSGLSTDSTTYRLPLPLAADTVTFIFASSEIQVVNGDSLLAPFYDTLSVGFEHRTTAITPDCGIQEEFFNVSVDTNLLDAEVEFDIIDPDANPNIKIYFP